jgi:hypothetical protein
MTPFDSARLLPFSLKAPFSSSPRLQVYELEVSYVLRDPSAGLRFQSHPLHVYSTARSLAPLDVDGPRCWFPCSDRHVTSFHPMHTQQIDMVYRQAYVHV